ncbi:hypothetical protein ACP0HM_25910 [Escherichia coli]
MRGNHQTCTVTRRLFLMPEICRRFLRNIFHTAVHNEEQLAALEEASWTSRLPSG